MARIRDQFNDNNLRSAFSTQGEADVRQTTWQGIESALPEPGSNGLQAAMSSFWSAWQNVSTTPEDSGARQALAQAGAGARRVVPDGLDDAHVAARRHRLPGERDGLAGQRGRQADRGRCNTAISKLEAVGQNPNDLLDQRDNLLDEMSTLGNTQITAGQNGVVTVTFGGVVVVDPSTATGLPATMPTRATFNPGYPATPTTAAGLTGGQLKGLIDAYSTTLNPAVTGSIPQQLDQLAISIHDAVNAQHQAGFDENGTAGGLFFAGAHDHVGVPARDQPCPDDESRADRGLEHRRGRARRLEQRARDDRDPDGRGADRLDARIVVRRLLRRHGLGHGARRADGHPRLEHLRHRREHAAGPAQPGLRRLARRGDDESREVPARLRGRRPVPCRR